MGNCWHPLPKLRTRLYDPITNHVFLSNNRETVLIGIIFLQAPEYFYNHLTNKFDCDILQLTQLSRSLDELA